MTEVQYANEQSGDYSIIQLDSAALSHKIGSAGDGYTMITGGTYLSPAVGTYVTRYGFTTGYSYGTVTATYVAIIPATEMTIYGMTKVTISEGDGGQPGDSGGPYLTGNAFCGVHHGHSTADSSIVYFTPYLVISRGGFTAIGTHNCSSWINADASNHSGYCTICQETIYEAHADHWSYSAGKCLRCGRTDPFTTPVG